MLFKWLAVTSSSVCHARCEVGMRMVQASKSATIPAGTPIQRLRHGRAIRMTAVAMRMTAAPAAQSESAYASWTRAEVSNTPAPVGRKIGSEGSRRPIKVAGTTVANATTAQTITAQSTRRRRLPSSRLSSAPEAVVLRWGAAGAELVGVASRRAFHSAPVWVSSAAAGGSSLPTSRRNIAGAVSGTAVAVAWLRSRWRWRASNHRRWSRHKVTQHGHSAV